MEVEVQRSEKFAPLYNLPDNTNVVVCIGGRTGRHENLRGVKVYSLFSNH